MKTINFILFYFQNKDKQIIVTNVQYIYKKDHNLSFSSYNDIKHL